MTLPWATLLVSWHDFSSLFLFYWILSLVYIHVSFFLPRLFFMFRNDLISRSHFICRAVFVSLSLLTLCLLICLYCIASHSIFFFRCTFSLIYMQLLFFSLSFLGVLCSSLSLLSTCSFFFFIVALLISVCNLFFSTFLLNLLFSHYYNYIYPFLSAHLDCIFSSQQKLRLFPFPSTKIALPLSPNLPGTPFFLFQY